MTLGRVSLAENGTGVRFWMHFTNERALDISFSYSPYDNFVVVDNRSRPVRISYLYGNDYGLICDKSATKVVPSGQTANLACTGEGNYFLAEVNLGDATISEIVVTAYRISSISEARWRIPLFH